MSAVTAAARSYRLACLELEVQVAEARDAGLRCARSARLPACRMNRCGASSSAAGRPSSRTRRFGGRVAEREREPARMLRRLLDAVEAGELGAGGSRGARPLRRMEGAATALEKAAMRRRARPGRSTGTTTAPVSSSDLVCVERCCDRRELETRVPAAAEALTHCISTAPGQSALSVHDPGCADHQEIQDGQLRGS